jgi:hypothetical protein
MDKVDKTLDTIKHYSVHAFGLILSLSAIYHTMTQFSENPLFKYFFGVGGVFAGLSIQYLRGRAAAYRKRDKNNDKLKAGFLWVIIVVCIIIFDFVSSFGILVTQIDKGEEKYNILASDRAEIEAEIRELQADNKTKKTLQEKEFTENKGRGTNYNRFEDEIKDNNDRITDFKKQLNTIKTKTATLDKSIFARLSEKSGIPSFWIEFSMFAGLMFLIYFIPLLTPWKVRLDDDDKADDDTPVINNTPPKRNVPRKHVTPISNVTPQAEIAVTSEGRLCACGCNRPARPGSKYFSDSCKTRLCRRNKKNKSLK